MTKTPPAADQPDTFPVRRSIVLALGLLLIALPGWAMASEFGGSPADWAEMLLGWMEHIPLAVYLLSFVVLPAFGVPILAYYLTIGVLIDGLGWTLLVAWACMGANMAFSYLLARGLRGPVHRLAMRRGYRIPQLRPGAEWQVILMVRASPLPWMMQNYLLALGGTRLLPYLLVGIPVQALVGLGVMLLGDAILSGDLRWAPIGLFVVAVVWVALRVIRSRVIRRQGIRLRDHLPPDPPSSGPR